VHRRTLNQLKIDAAVAIGEEHLLTIDAALSKVVGDTREYGSGHSGHIRISGSKRRNIARNLETCRLSPL